MMYLGDRRSTKYMLSRYIVKNSTARFDCVFVCHALSRPSNILIYHQFDGPKSNIDVLLEKLKTIVDITHIIRTQNQKKSRDWIVCGSSASVAEGVCAACARAKRKCKLKHASFGYGDDVPVPEWLCWSEVTWRQHGSQWLESIVFNYYSVVEDFIHF